MASVSNKVVIVTGASRGLGLEWCRQLLKKNNKVIASVRNPENSDKLKQLSGNLEVTKLDTSDEESIKEWAVSLKRLVDHVDVVINNAGIIGQRQAFADVQKSNLLEVFSTNAAGPLLVTQQLVKNNIIGLPSSIVANVTSKVGSVDDNSSGGGYAYRASKSALNIINKSMSIDLQELGICCVLLHPGWVKTDMTGDTGLITVDQSVGGMLDVLESDRKLNGCWYDYAGKEIPW
eukprot:TRINITY_DN33139_c0_g1_i1.p1 TRINITY_DN33139_c0_g1~~TRINITY_DN33139_c0_g1_i1.p1  ORF type:complete len:259 (+),score=33.83 TRINITY_DN33139_c0_g1_i1:77-778(+)